MLSHVKTLICVFLTLFITFIVLLSPAQAIQGPPIIDGVKKSHVDIGNNPSRFGYKEEALTGAKKTVKRALEFVGQANKACANKTCQGKCLHLAAKVWGYPYSGSNTAKSHWLRLNDLGLTYADRKPPVGALVYWDVSWTGHVATYVGDGMVVSNWDGRKGHGVYLLPIDIFENKWSSARYLGWSNPKFFATHLKN